MSEEIEDESTHVTVLHATVLERLFYRIKLREKGGWIKLVDCIKVQVILNVSDLCLSMLQYQKSS